MRARAAALTLTATCLLAGCTPTVSDSVRTPASGSAGAEDPTPSASSREDVDAEEFLTSIAAATEEAGSYHLEMTVDMADVGMETSTDFVAADDPEDIALSMTMTTDIAGVGGETFELLLVDSEVYYRTGDSDGMFFRGDPDDPSDPTYGLVEAAQAEADPLASLLAMEEAIMSITESGSDTIDGVDVSEFEVVVDPSQLPDDGLGSFSGADVPDDTSITYIYSIDERDLPVRITAVLDLAGEEMAMAMEFTEWGDDIVIEAPDPELVTEGPGVFG